MHISRLIAIDNTIEAGNKFQMDDLATDTPIYRVNDCGDYMLEDDFLDLFINEREFLEYMAVYNVDGITLNDINALTDGQLQALVNANMDDAIIYFTTAE